jgi:hypothetical protein
MTHVDHGFWKLYTRATPRADAPPGAMFAARESDGQDWYEYVHPNPNPNFKPGNVVIAAAWREDVNGYVVGPATYDPTAIFPAGHIVWGIDDYTGKDPQGDLGNKIYDPATGTFTDMPPIVPPQAQFERRVLSLLETLMARVDRLEGKK